MSHGYADFRVISADHSFDEHKGRYYITFTVEEGARYRFGAVDIDSSLPGVNTARLKGLIRTRPGNTFNADMVEKTIENLSIELAREGYAFAQVRPRGDRDYATHGVSVTYLIDEGPRTYIERINIVGNTKTRDYVVRREFDVSEGDPYNRVMMDRAERRLRDLGYFKTVHISAEPGSAPDKVIVDVFVEDQSTGDISLGAGISTRGLIAEVGLNEKNFLGRGQQLGIKVGYGQEEQNYDISFTDPYFLGHRISFGVNAYRNQYSAFFNRPFDETINGGGVTFGFPVTDDLTFSVNYKIAEDDVTNSAPRTAAYFPNSNVLTSSVGYGIRYSTLDSLLDPHNGFYGLFTQDFAGVGGDTQFVRSVGDVQYYHELVATSDIVGLVRVTGGNITGLGQTVRILDNFFKGGETIRGFASYGYGPVVQFADGSTEPIGGKNFWASTAEVQFPLPGIPPDFGLKGAVFADAGSLWGVDKPAGAIGTVVDDNSIRSSAGVSVLWSSPIGLLRADFAQALTKAKTDETEWFRFSAGKRF